MLHEMSNHFAPPEPVGMNVSCYELLLSDKYSGDLRLTAIFIDVSVMEDKTQCSCFGPGDPSLMASPSGWERQQTLMRRNHGPLID